MSQKDIRFSFSRVPAAEPLLQKYGLPFGCLFTPMSPIEEPQLPLEKSPVMCPGCKCILNPFAAVDASRRVWNCPICNRPAPLPAEYHSEAGLQSAEELKVQNKTIEYVINTGDVVTPVYFFVVDTCCSAQQHQALMTLLLQTIASVPENSIIGLITFGTIIYLHEMFADETPRSYLFNGKRTYTPQELKDMLHIGPLVTTQTRICATLKDAETMLNTIIDQLEPDSFDVPKGYRASRCTGAAIDLAIALLETFFPLTGGHVLVFTGGPITKGPGKMAEFDRTMNVRSLADIEKGTAYLTKQSYQYFKELSVRANAHNIVVNYIAASFEETGFLEVEPLVTATGGFHCIGEGWNDADLIQTIVTYFSRIAPLSGSEGIITINGSNSLSVSGQIGFGTANPHVGSFQSQRIIGCGSTDQWHVCGLTPTSTIGFYFDVTRNAVPNSKATIQILTRYRHFASGITRLRVTTTQIDFINDITSVDHEVAIALLGRFAMFRSRFEDPGRIIDDIDESIITYLRNFKANSFQGLEDFSRSVFYLRRLKVFTAQNSTPDLLNSIRATFCTLNSEYTSLFIVPVLKKYSLSEQPQAISLSLESLNPEYILVLTSYNRVVVWYGRSIVSWRNQGVQEQADHENFRLLLEDSLHDAKTYAMNCFPAPQFVTCDQDSSLSRYLLAAISPPPLAAPPKKPAMSLHTEGQDFSDFMRRLEEVSF